MHSRPLPGAPCPPLERCRAAMALTVSSHSHSRSTASPYPRCPASPPQAWQNWSRHRPARHDVNMMLQEASVAWAELHSELAARLYSALFEMLPHHHMRLSCSSGMVMTAPCISGVNFTWHPKRDLHDETSRLNNPKLVQPCLPHDAIAIAASRPATRGAGLGPQKINVVRREDRGLTCRLARRRGRAYPAPPHRAVEACHRHPG